MRKLFMVTAVVSIICVISSVTYSAPYWTKTYAGADGEEAASVKQTSDGGYILLGSTNSFGSGEFNIWLVKLDTNGIVIWQKTYGDGWSSGARDICETSDKGYIIASTKKIEPKEGEYISYVNLLIKVDGNGDIIWQKTYDVEGSSFQGVNCIAQTMDGGYIVAGYSGTYDDVWILKLNNDGDIIWQNSYGQSSERDGALSIQQTKDKGYIVAGYSGNDSMFLKLDNEGGIEWAKTYGGYIIRSEAQSIQQTSDGQFIAVCNLSGSGIWVLKLDRHGNSIWQKVYDFNEAYAIHQTKDKGYIIATEKSFSGYRHIALLKLKKNGNIAWQKVYGNNNNYNDHIASIQQTSDGGYIVAGETFYFGGTDSWDIWLLRLDNKGDIPGCDIISTYNASVVNEYIKGKEISLTTRSIPITVRNHNVLVYKGLGNLTTVCEADAKSCPVEIIYGVYSKEADLLRFYRDNVLRNTPEGKELIKLYYKWSPLIAEIITRNEKFKEGIQGLIDEVLFLNAK